MSTKSKPSKASFREMLVEKIEEYMDKAFDTTDPELREKYRDVIHEMEQLLLMVSDLE